MTLINHYNIKGENNMEKRRLCYLDNIKAFVMILIIWGHCSGEHDFSNLFNWIYSFHVPIFFVISGYLLQLKYSKKATYKPNFKLFVPYFVYSLIFALLKLTINFISNGSLAKDNLIESLEHTFSFYGISAVWYIACLIFAEIIFYFEVKKISILKCAVLNTILGIIACYIPTNDNILLIAFVRIFPALLCLNIGAVIFEFKKTANTIEILALTALSVLLVFINGKTEMFLMNTGKYPILYIPEIIISSMVIFYIFQKLFDKKIWGITWFGQNSLILLCTHQMIIYMLYPVLNHLNIDLGKIIPQSIILTLIVVLIEIPIILVINKFFKWTLGNIKLPNNKLN